jgi:hypothetical protein
MNSLAATIETERNRLRGTKPGRRLREALFLALPILRRAAELAVVKVPSPGGAALLVVRSIPCAGDESVRTDVVIVDSAAERAFAIGDERSLVLAFSASGLAIEEENAVEWLRLAIELRLPGAPALLIAHPDEIGRTGFVPSLRDADAVGWHARKPVVRRLRDDAGPEIPGKRSGTAVDATVAEGRLLRRGLVLVRRNGTIDLSGTSVVAELSSAIPRGRPDETAAIDRAAEKRATTRDEDAGWTDAGRTKLIRLPPTRIAMGRWTREPRSTISQTTVAAAGDR